MLETRRVTHPWIQPLPSPDISRQRVFTACLWKVNRVLADPEGRQQRAPELDAQKPESRVRRAPQRRRKEGQTLRFQSPASGGTPKVAGGGKGRRIQGPGSLGRGGVGQGPKGQGGRGGTPELISANEKPKKTGPLSPAGKQDCPSLRATPALSPATRYHMPDTLYILTT